MAESWWKGLQDMLVPKQLPSSQTPMAIRGKILISDPVPGTVDIQKNSNDFEEPRRPPAQRKLNKARNFSLPTNLRRARRLEMLADRVRHHVTYSLDEVIKPTELEQILDQESARSDVGNDIGIALPDSPTLGRNHAASEEQGEERSSPTRPAPAVSAEHAPDGGGATARSLMVSAREGKAERTGAR